MYTLSSVCIFIVHDRARIQLVFVIDGIENRLLDFSDVSIVPLTRCRKEHCGDILPTSSLIFYYSISLRPTKLYYPDIFFSNNTWVKREIGRICGELQTRAEGLTCSNPVGASLRGPRTSRGLWPGLDVAVNGGGGGVIV